MTEVVVFLCGMLTGFAAHFLLWLRAALANGTAHWIGDQEAEQ